MAFRRRCAALTAAAFLTAALLALTGCTADPSPQASSSASAPPAGVPGSGVSIPDLVARVEPSVVTVYAGDGLGSGVVYRAEGVVVTNAHVVRGQQSVRVAFADGTQTTGRVVGADEIADLAVVRTERTGLPAATFQPQLPRPGETVLAMGSPLGLENSVTQGIISGIGRQLPTSQGDRLPRVDLLQTDAAISPGNSGGALVNLAGEVVGLNEAYVPPQVGAVSIGFAIPAATVVDGADQLLAKGYITHPFLGVSATQLTPQIARALAMPVEMGALVQRVADNGPAAMAGIRAGDVIVEFGGTAVRQVSDLLSALRKTKPTDKVRVGIYRGGDRQTVEVTVGALATTR